MVTGERSAKLLDFGIAKMFDFAADADEATAAALTGVGEVVGTVGYMSPEQLKGLPLDARSDLFSVGAVLYEAVSGERAFPGRTAAERMEAILSRDPSPLRVSGAPAELWALLARALAREPSLRYPSAASFLSDLRRVTAGEFVAAMPDTLAVMDFENLSRNPDDDWIGSGVAESVAAELARVPGLSVVARAKAVKVLKGLGGAADALELGHALGCRWVLSGSYQRMGPALRMTSRLTEVATGRAVATEKLDGKLDEIFPMQDRLASSTAAVLNLTIPESTGESAAPSLDAYEAMPAAGGSSTSRARACRAGAEAFGTAIAADPEHAPSLAGLAAVTRCDSPSH
jgi:non-specific serine/threonine protein kinase